MGRFTIDLTVEEVTSLLKADVSQGLRTQLVIIRENLLLNGHCQECGGNGYYMGDFGMDADCRSCRDEGRSWVTQPKAI